MAGTLDLFEHEPGPPEPIAEGAYLLRGFATDISTQLLNDLQHIAEAAPFRHQVTPGGYSMSVAMTSCGELGWVTDKRGYRYSPVDPQSNQPWPALPESFEQLAIDAAATAGYPQFSAQSCLINRYETGARMALHQDKDEQDLTAPIVSVSLGAPISFLFGGPTRSHQPARVKIEHGDVLVWGGPSRLFFHGVAPLGKRADHPLTGPVRYNLTFRKVL
ncbi:DNA oxidative demethylase AlkB [Pseudomonas sp. gcc21]|uniref:DNA oxidative demethylase AlkB n=1 Tax=Pseudomonas sp. gcc21 TaxID=2726989 RepID=UPI0014518EB9|nr:DNA oxidative demethylase AlkB [Pseudomonas sp. gcc21]QJD58704.1 DNA oxidative demethylase AlkB [Pseudomonas sp. gcc21]